MLEDDLDALRARVRQQHAPHYSLRALDATRCCGTAPQCKALTIRSIITGTDARRCRRAWTAADIPNRTFQLGNRTF
jgi:hypothetical protein